MSATSETFPSGGKSLTLDVYVPTASGKVPAVLVLHGSAGLSATYGADIESFAEALAGKQIAAAIPHYLETTGDNPALPTDAGELSLTIATKQHLWRQACADALAAMAVDPRFDSARLGVMGFSLGGHLALSLAMAPPASAPIAGVVDFFGPTFMLDSSWSSLPPVQIFHGGKDEAVPISESERLQAGLIAAGRKSGVDYFYDIYPGQKHGFTGTDLAKSRDRTVAFFEAILLEAD